MGAVDELQGLLVSAFMRWAMPCVNFCKNTSSQRATVLQPGPSRFSVGEPGACKSEEKERKQQEIKDAGLGLMKSVQAGHGCVWLCHLPRMWDGQTLPELL